MPLIAAEVCECFQKNLLSCFLNQAALPKETTGNLENPGTIASHDLGKSRLITVARVARQLEVRRLFVIVGQKRSSSEWWVTDSYFESANPWGNIFTEAGGHLAQLSSS